MTRIPLFPLRSVLCPGVALPLHIFEARYRLMIDRCIERDEPFGVVLLHEGREVGPPRGEMAAVGTTAAIRRAGRYPDGRLDIVTVGQQRFELESIDTVTEPYLIGEVRLLGEPTGSEADAARHAARVGRRFLEYLDLMQPDGGSDGPEIEIEFEIEVEAGDVEPVDRADGVESGEGPRSVTDLAGLVDPAGRGDTSARAGRIDRAEGMAAADGSLTLEGPDSLLSEMNAAELTPQQRRELLMAAARRLTSIDDPTALSYVLTALIQVDLASRQALLEAPDTVERLRGLDRLITRESWFLREGLRPIIIDAGGPGRRAG